MHISIDYGNEVECWLPAWWLHALPMWNMQLRAALRGMMAAGWVPGAADRIPLTFRCPLFSPPAGQQRRPTPCAEDMGGAGGGGVSPGVTDSRFQRDAWSALEDDRLGAGATDAYDFGAANDDDGGEEDAALKQLLGGPPVQ